MAATNETASGTVLLASEAEFFIEALQTFPIKEIGSPRWMTQHEYIEKLNMQAIISASHNQDEFVKELFITTGKIHVLIHELIGLEVWKTKVFPKLLASDLKDMKTTLPVYMVLFHEVTIITLIETMFFHKEACESAEDHVMDLLDYCYRRLSYFAANDGNSPSDDGELMMKTAATSSEPSVEELQTQHDTILFSCCFKSISVMSYIVQHMKSLPLSVMNRALCTHDVVLLFVHLVENQPWLKRGSKGELMKFVDNKWTVFPESERMKLTKVQGQVWLALYGLLMDPECQRKYEFTTYKKEQVLKLRSFMNELLLDQIPALSDMHRFLEHLAIMEPPSIKKDLILEQVPVMYDNFFKENSSKWMEIMKYQKQNFFTPSPDEIKKQAKMWADTYNFDALDDLIPEAPKCANCGKSATKRCSRCQNEWYCGRECQVKHWSRHKPVCSITKP